MTKLTTCLAVLLSCLVGNLRSMSLEERAEDFADFPDNMVLPPQPEWGDRGDWGPPSVPVVKRVPFREATEDDDDEEEEKEAISPETLLRAALEMQKEDADNAAKKAKKEATPRSHVHDVSPHEMEQLLGDGPQRHKKSDLLRQYLQSALEKKEKAAKRKKRVVKRGAVAPQESETVPAGGDKDPRQKLLQKLLVANALLNAENGYLTDALNAATIAQTNGNDATVLKKEMAGIENAEKIQTVMEQLKIEEKKTNDKPPEAIDETVVVTDNSIANFNACPAVKDLSTGCRTVISTFRFAMDQDAIDACDAHSVCYGCSSAMQSNRELCDQIFKAQSKNMCAKEPHRRQCDAEANTLLRAMREAHEDTYQSSRERAKVCKQPCVDAFFSAVYRPRR